MSFLVLACALFSASYAAACSITIDGTITEQCSENTCILLGEKFAIEVSCASSIVRIFMSHSCESSRLLAAVPTNSTFHLPRRDLVAMLASGSDTSADPSFGYLSTVPPESAVTEAETAAPATSSQGETVPSDGTRSGLHEPELVKIAKRSELTGSVLLPIVVTCPLAHASSTSVHIHIADASPSSTTAPHTTIIPAHQPGPAGGRSAVVHPPQPDVISARTPVSPSPTLSSSAGPQPGLPGLPSTADSKPELPGPPSTAGPKPELPAAGPQPGLPGLPSTAGPKPGLSVTAAATSHPAGKTTELLGRSTPRPPMNCSTGPRNNGDDDDNAGAVPANASAIVHCSRSFLTEVPPDLPADVVDVHLAHNYIRQILRKDFAGLTRIQHLFLGHNEVEIIIDGSFHDQAHMSELILSFNQLGFVDNATFAGLTSLTRLDLSYNSISAVNGDAFMTLTSLRYLTINNNRLTMIPENLFASMSTLNFLDLSSNFLEVIGPRTLSALTALGYLSLENNKIANLALNIFDAQHALRDLLLNQNSLSSLGNGGIDGPWGALTSITRLEISGNQLTELDPTTFTTMTLMTILRIDGNMISELAGDVFFAMPNLRELSLVGNQLTTLDPDCFASITLLSRLRLGGNNLTAAPDFSLLSNLAVLDLSSNKLSAVPIISAGNLEILNLANNLYTMMNSDSFAHLSQLGMLILGSNFIEELPANMLEHLRQLNYLDLNLNPLSSLPENFFRTNSRLRTLNLSRTGVALTSTSLSGLTALQAIDLSANGLSELPKELFIGSTRLNSIFLSDNSFIVIPSDSLTNLTSLLELDLAFNDFYSLGVTFFSFLPSTATSWVQSICSMKNPSDACPANSQLFTINLGGNPFEYLSKTAFAALPSNVRVILSSAAAPMSLPSCCGLEWLSQNPQLVVEDLSCMLGGQVRLLTDFPPLSSICPCKMQQFELSGACYRLSNWTVFQGECRDSACPTGFSLYPTGSTFSCQDPSFGNNEFLLFETACQECQVPGCSECQLRTATCTRCAAQLFLHDSAHCVGTCPGSFVGVNGTCVGCPPYCRSCSSLDKCDACQMGYGIATVEAGCVLCQEGCQCATDLDSCVAACLETGAIHADCSSNSRSTPVYYYLVPALGGVVLCVVIMFLLWRRFRHKTATLSKSLIEKEQQVVALKKAWEISPQDVILRDKIGSGGHGDVFIAQWRDMTVAIKTVKGVRATMTEKLNRDLDREISLLQTIRHPNIVLFFGAGTFSDGTPFLVTELMERGPLSVVLVEEEYNLPWRTKHRFAWEAAQGMAHVHALGRMHRDLKSGNLLVSKTMHIKVADFGTASFASITTREAPQLHPLSGLAHTQGLGTPLWMSPEMLASQHYGPSSDVFSFGMVMWEIASHQLPWGDAVLEDNFLGTLLGRLRCGERPPLDPLWPDRYVAIMDRCWANDPQSRPTFPTLVRELEAVLYNRA
eukprot:m.193388 g.193388  ORF g.193388 m.193388 type:complete len:1456 (+) comp10069_c6_seq16:20-4387(+)